MATETKTVDATAVKTVTEDTSMTIEPTVRVFIPKLEDSNSEITLDQTETVIINGNVTRIKRGEYVDVKVPVFLQLKNRYPNI